MMMSRSKIYQYLAALFLVTCASAAYANSQLVRVQSTSCRLLGLSQIQFDEIKLNRRLIDPATSADDKLICQKINWNNESFLTVTYPIQVPISYSGKLEKNWNHVIYRLENGRLIQVAVDIVKQRRPHWDTQNQHLVLRWLAKGKNGQATLSGGYVYTPKSKTFEDYVKYAFNNKWKIIEEP